MGTIVINVNGVYYPCKLTMGAMVRFADLMGKEMSECTDSVRDMCAFVWSCAGAAANREGRQFDLDFQTFCDCLEPEDLLHCWEGLRPEGAEEGEAVPEEGEKKSE